MTRVTSKRAGTRFANLGGRARDAGREEYLRNAQSMLREFKDKTGVSWQVWDVYPASPKTTPQSNEPLSHFPSRDMSGGWLCFQCDNEKRRLTPIPPTWEVCKGEELEALCNQAGYVSRAQ